LEKFAQTSMLSLIDKNDDLKKYYGIYYIIYKNPEKFKFVIETNYYFNSWLNISKINL